MKIQQAPCPPSPGQNCSKVVVSRTFLLSHCLLHVLHLRIKALTLAASNKRYRLEGLSGLSVQDVELKLIAETPPSQSSGALSTDNSTSAVDGNDRASDSLDGDRGSPPPTGAVTVANSKNTKGRKKNKKGKKQSMLSQRGPLLITHTGERARVFFSFFLFVSYPGGFGGIMVLRTGPFEFMKYCSNAVALRTVVRLSPRVCTTVR